MAILPGREEAEKWLRDALNHLYDLGYLENHPLGDLLVRPEQSSGRRGQDLRKVLIAAIQARKPARGTPPQSADWRGYQILEQHVLGGLSPAEMMQKLNISRSLFFLEKARILKQVFEDLWNQAAMEGVPLPQAVLSRGAPLPVSPEAAELLRDAHFARVDLGALLESIRPLLEPLSQSHDTRIRVNPEPAHSVPRADRVLLRQILLSLVNELLQLVGGGEIEIAAFDQSGAYGVRILARRPAGERLALRLEERHGLGPETAHALVAAMDGRLSIETGEGGLFTAVLAWLHPRTGNRLMLVDDHPDVADLCRRHLDGSGWEISWAASAAEARRLLAQTRPAAILLDVILPQEDGWDFLLALKADPLLRDIPVIVCSAINEPDLVRSLGAQGYLPKPFSAAQIAQALAPFAAQPA